MKDLAETAGIRTTFGSPIFASYVPSFDAPHVALLKQAGAVVVGKTNTPEFGAGTQTFNPVFGPTRNPFDPRLTPGGSSGGAAAAVAAGMVPFADGSDLASSVRNPAAFCGLVGLRTTPGLVPDEAFDPCGDRPPRPQRQDAALLLAGMCGRDPGLPLARPDRPADFLDLRPASLRGLRVAWTFDLGDLPVQPEVRRCSARCGSGWSRPGARWPTRRRTCRTPTRFSRSCGPRCWSTWPRCCAPIASRSRPTLAWNIEKGLALTGEQIAAARAGHAAIFGRVKSFLPTGPYEVLALPTVQVVPFPVETEWVARDQRRAHGDLHRLDAVLLADHGQRAPAPSRCQPA